jgi:acetolactate synthase-1/2/3 large subunit
MQRAGDARRNVRAIVDSNRCMPTGAELFVETLQQLGITDVFTLVGDHLNHVLAAASRAGLRIIDMRHESGVTHAAEVSGRLGRRPAVALVTGGPGHTNSLTGVAAAYLSCSPVILVSGARPSHLAERGAFQDIDQLSMARPVVKWSGEPPEPGQIPFYLRRAYTEANSGRKGPVHLNIPVDVFTRASAGPVRAQPPVPRLSPPQPDSRDIAVAVALLRRAERPVVIAGSGVWWSDAGAVLQQFIERTRLPLYTITFARGVVSDEHPLCMGYADPAQNRAALHALRAADVVFVLGKRMDHRLAMGGPRLFSPDAKFIQVDLHGPELGLNRGIEVAIESDARTAIGAMLDEIGTLDWPERPWLAQVRAWRLEWRDYLHARASVTGGALPTPAAVFAELRKCLPREAMLSWDGGDFTHWGRAMLPAMHPGGWIRLGPLAAIGSSLPNALALKLAYPDRPVVMITGDGSLGFYLAELDSLVRHGLPVVIIVGNDGGWGLERELQGATEGTTVACALRRSRYDLVMQAFGGGGELVERVDQIRPAMERALGSGVPYAINIAIEGVRSPFTEWQIEAKAAGLSSNRGEIRREA